MTLSPLDVLFIVLAVCIFIITIFLSVLLHNMSQVLKDSRRVIEKAETAADQVNTYLLIPARVFNEGYAIYQKFRERVAKSKE